VEASGIRLLVLALLLLAPVPSPLLE